MRHWSEIGLQIWKQLKIEQSQEKSDGYCLGSFQTPFRFSLESPKHFLQIFESYFCCQKGTSYNLYFKRPKTILFMERDSVGFEDYNLSNVPFNAQLNYALTLLRHFYVGSLLFEDHIKVHLNILFLRLRSRNYL
jgi:hypothetical protein